MAGKMKAKRGPYDDLDKDFKTTIESMKDDEIRARVSAIHLELQRLMNAKEDDQDLKNAASAFQEAGRTYRDNAKGAKLMTKYALFILESRGKA